MEEGERASVCVCVCEREREREREGGRVDLNGMNARVKAVHSECTLNRLLDLF